MIPADAVPTLIVPSRLTAGCRAMNLNTFRTAGREWLRHQQVFLSVAVLVYGVFLSLGVTTDLWGIVIYSLGIGNLAVFAGVRLRGLFINRRFPYNWFVFVPLLLAISVVSVAAASVVVFWLRARGAAFWLFAQANVPFAVVVTFAVGVMSYLATDMRLRFERRNRELQQAVTTGKHTLRQQEEEVAKAREVQEALLPRKVHHADGIEIVGSWQPARVVGGDYFDVLAFTDSKVGICIGDVVGKGISAALLMANLQAAVRAFASELTSPSIVCERVNRVLCTNMASGKFVTFFYGLLDTKTRTLAFTSAGHFPPLLVRSSGAARLENGGALFGVFPDWRYEDSEVQLQRGDRLILYTDGVTEAMNATDEDFGEPRLMAAAVQHVYLGAAALQTRLMREVETFCDGTFHDDATLVIAAID